MTLKYIFRHMLPECYLTFPCPITKKNICCNNAVKELFQQVDTCLYCKIPICRELKSMSLKTSLVAYNKPLDTLMKIK